MANLYSGSALGGGSMAVIKNDGPDDDARQASALVGEHYTAREVMRRLLAYVGPADPVLVWGFVASAVSVARQLWGPIIIGEAIDCMVEAGSVNFAALRGPLTRLAMVIPLVALGQWVSTTCTNRLSYETIRALRDDSFRVLKGLPLSFFDTHPHGDLLARIAGDVDQVGDGLLQGLTQLFSGIMTIVGTLVFMCSLSVPVALVVMALTPLSILVASQIAKRSSASFAAQQALQGQLGGYAEETISNQRLITSFSQSERCQKRFEDINANLFVAGEHAQFVSSLTNPSTRIVNNIIYAVVAVVGCLCVVTGQPSPLSVGQVQSFLSYSNQYMKPFNEISGVVTQLQAALASARRVFALLDAPREEPDAADAIELVDCTGDLDFRQVDFSYQPSRPLLRDITFHAAPGQRIALVGPTGCGKTTLINLLLRFYDLKGGSIRIDGHDIAQCSRKSLRGAFCMVLQDTWLFSGTVRENICYGRPDATDEQVEEAARRAHAHKFIVQLPQGYDTMVGEGGGALSQGQRQLLCIARVMLTDPSILLLDEATSSIDTRTELQVQDAFDRMMEGRTSLVVAHRLSTVRNADCILVMQDGVISERGTHEELLEQGGFYAHLYASQWEGMG